MSRDFLAEFKQKLNQINKSEMTAPINSEPKRYNIHKRSLPVGLDKIILYSITSKEAEWWIENKLKSKEKQNDDKKTIIYYDLIATNATDEEKSVYFNTRPVVETN